MKRVRVRVTAFCHQQRSKEHKPRCRWFMFLVENLFALHLHGDDAYKTINKDAERVLLIWKRCKLSNVEVCWRQLATWHPIRQGPFLKESKKALFIYQMPLSNGWFRCMYGNAYLLFHGL